MEGTQLIDTHSHYTAVHPHQSPMSSSAASMAVPQYLFLHPATDVLPPAAPFRFFSSTLSAFYRSWELNGHLLQATPRSTAKPRLTLVRRSTPVAAIPSFLPLRQPF